MAEVTRVTVKFERGWERTLMAAARPGLDEAGQVVERGAVSRCPVAPYDTPGRPHMRDLIHRVVGEDGDGPYEDVVSPADYSAAVEFGTKPHIIRSTGSWPLRNPRTGQVFGPVVHHPGTRPQPFLRPALDDIRGRDF